jgi:hypothetical protein
MTENPALFEEMLSVYPADKRELARAAYNRFVDGDSAHFFTQLFLLLDVYANYAKRIPQAVSETNQSTLASLKRVREEIGLLAQNVESRSVNLDNQCEETSARCLATEEKCEAAAKRLEKLTQDIARQIDTQAIIESIRQSIDAGVREKVVQPFLDRSEALTNEVLPTLQQIKEANAEAGRVWPGRIWKVALTCSLLVAFFIASVVILFVTVRLETSSRRTLALEIAKEARTLQQNKDAFRDLAVANTPVKVVRVANGGVQPVPSAYALIVPGAQGTEMRGSDGYIFFASPRQETDLEKLQRQTKELDDALQKIKEANK